MTDGSSSRTPPYESLRPARQMRAGDPLRAVAALSVLIYHVITVVQQDMGGTVRDTYGDLLGPLILDLSLGLHVFFALTGYLLGRMFLNAYIQGTPFPSIRRYARNRALRILPAFWILFAISLVVLGTADATQQQLVAAFALLQMWIPSDATSQRFAQAWSLHVEAVFYVLLPIMVGLIVLVTRPLPVLNVRGRTRFAAAAVAAVWVAGLLLCAVGPPISYTIPAFVPGLALAIIETQASSWFFGVDRSALGYRLAIGCVVASALPLGAYAFVPVSAYAPRAAIASAGILLLLGGVLIRQWSDGGAWRALDNGIMHWIGARAYSVYLIHFVVIVQLVGYLDLHGEAFERVAVIGTVSIAVTLVASYISFRWFEMPFLARRAPSILSVSLAEPSPQERSTLVKSVGGRSV